ncbi:MAG: hypothetical protein PHV25_02405 [Candidatus Pacebacteria bacterium]|nr:hypothetical protein [Candidatus Paceibacterota bacterium]
MAINIIPKKEEKDVLGTAVFYFGLVLLVVLLIISTIFYILTWRIENQQIVEIQGAMEAQKTREMMELEARMDKTLAKVNDFVLVLDQKKTSKEILAVLEDLIHPEVYLDSVILSATKETISIEGTAKDATVFGQQIDILNNNDDITSATIDSFERNIDRTINFSITINFGEEINEEANEQY